jgi:hypothetical protein
MAFGRIQEINGMGSYYSFTNNLSRGFLINLFELKKCQDNTGLP